MLKKIDILEGGPNPRVYNYGGPNPLADLVRGDQIR